ncbi:NrdJb [Marinimicrobium agarilyticum]|uniref:TSCPD domain-containing protein n=1 Tax=Marinimicrobium agarilyticum TaxID=306546 RepID=UPI00041CB415|nr:NrdJb [Marinimicrobium agarilyticum]
MNAKVIDKKITGFSIKKPEAEKEPDIERMHEKFERPETLEGSTYKIKTPLSDHALYITINDVVLNPGTDHEVRRPFEVFINSKNLEHFQWVVALTRVISAVFRKGGDVTFLVEELKAVFDPQGGYFKSGGRFMPSLVAEIGDAIETHMKRIGLIQEDALSETQKEVLREKQIEYEQKHRIEHASEEFPPTATLCLKCHTKAVIVMDGCKTCLNCGASKCG